jgi:outer membrane protein assembly factor BamB
MWPGDGVAVDGVRRIVGGQVYRELLAGGFEPVGGGEVVETLSAYTHLREGAVAVSDLTGEGHPSLVIGSYDGTIYSLDLRDGSLDWTYDLAAEIGPIVAADTTGDGLVELLVTAGDGNLYAIGQAADLGVIGGVVDGGAEDLDLVPPGTEGFGVDTFTATWTATEGGSEVTAGYLVRLETDTGAVVADWEDVDEALTTTRTLPTTLVAEQVYRVVVLPYGATGTGQLAVSDGFRLDEAWFTRAGAETDADAGPTDAGRPAGPHDAAALATADTSATGAPPATTSGCSDCAGGGPAPMDAALWGLLAAWLLRRSRRALR